MAAISRHQTVDAPGGVLRPVMVCQMRRASVSMPRNRAACNARVIAQSAWARAFLYAAPASPRGTSEGERQTQAPGPKVTRNFRAVSMVPAEVGVGGTVVTCQFDALAAATWALAWSRYTSTRSQVGWPNSSQSDSTASQDSAVWLLVLASTSTVSMPSAESRRRA